MRTPSPPTSVLFSPVPSSISSPSPPTITSPVAKTEKEKLQAIIIVNSKVINFFIIHVLSKEKVPYFHKALKLGIKF